MCIDQFRAHIKSISKRKLQEKIEDIVEGAISAQGDKKALKSTIKDIERAMHDLEIDG